MTDELRLQRLERDVLALEAEVKQLPAMLARLDGIEKSVAETNDSVKSLRTTLITFALTIAGSAIAVLVGLLQVAQ